MSGFLNVAGGLPPLPEIDRSLRLNSADSAYLNRSIGTTTDKKKWTLSFWCKRSTLGTTQMLMSAVDGSYSEQIKFTSGDLLEWNRYYTGYRGQKTSVQVFRDTTAHLHIVVQLDAVAGTVKLFANSVELSTTTGSAIINEGGAINGNVGVPHYLFRNTASDSYLNGYVSRVCFVDGAVLTPSDFAYTDYNGQWRSKPANVCKTVVDAGGVNSFMLEFDDGTSTSTLGHDYEPGIGVNGYDVAMLHLNGTNGSTVMTDEGGTNWTAGGSAQISTAVSKFSGSSVTFNGSTDYIERTYTADTSIATENFTIDFWVYFNSVTGIIEVFSQRVSSAAYCSISVIRNATSIQIYASSTGSTWNIASGVSFGTVAASQWYHVAITREGSVLKAYLNGTGTTISSGASSLYENSANWRIGGVAGYYLNGYVDEFRFLKNKVVWTGNFTPPTAEYSNVRLNNWKVNNFTRSAGTNDDWMTDTPTNNYCTLSNIDSQLPSNLSNANLYYAGVSTGGGSPYHNGSLGASNGKVYFEVVPHAGGSGLGIFAGIHDSTTPRGGTGSAGTINFYNVDLKVWNNGSAVKTMTSGVSAGQTLQVAVDLNIGKIWFGVNDTWLKASGDGTTNPATGDNPAATFTPGNKFWLPFVGSPDNWGGAHVNFGQRAFNYTPPTGFKALCTKNLPIPSIVYPNQHFNVKLDTGANIKTTAEAVYPSFFEWIKDRANTNNHQLIDSVRGTSAVLQSNTTAAETTYSAPSGNSVAWVWKANGSGSSNTDGTITSTVSANQTAGFSIVTYTGNGSSSTVGHGLGITPAMIIVKKRNSGAGDDWAVYHSSGASTKTFWLNLTNSEAVSTRFGAMTSSTFGITTYAETNENGKNFVGYCFAEIPNYSKFGKYSGNGVSDGPFVWCGFRPKYVMVKRIDAANNWNCFDTLRGPYNVTTGGLSPNTSGAEYSSGTPLDITSNGFKIRDPATYNINASGGTYIFAAFAEAPFKFSNAR